VFADCDKKLFRSVVNNVIIIALQLKRSFFNPKQAREREQNKNNNHFSTMPLIIKFGCVF